MIRKKGGELISIWTHTLLLSEMMLVKFQFLLGM